MVRDAGASLSERAWATPKSGFFLDHSDYLDTVTSAQPNSPEWRERASFPEWMRNVYRVCRSLRLEPERATAAMLLLTRHRPCTAADAKPDVRRRKWCSSAGVPHKAPHRALQVLHGGALSRLCHITLLHLQLKVRQSLPSPKPLRCCHRSRLLRLAGTTCGSFPTFCATASSAGWSSTAGTFWSSLNLCSATRGPARS